MRAAPGPGLAPATASHRDAVRSSVIGSGAAAVLVLVVGTVRGDGTLPDLGTCLIALVGGALLLALGLRSRTTAGPGWLHAQRLVGGEWVRTDQLAEVRSWATPTDVFLELRDRDGRSAQVPWSALVGTPAVGDRVRRDVRTSAGAGADLDARAAHLLLGAR